MDAWSRRPSSSRPVSSTSTNVGSSEETRPSTSRPRQARGESAQARPPADRLRRGLSPGGAADLDPARALAESCRPRGWWPTTSPGAPTCWHASIPMPPRSAWSAPPSASRARSCPTDSPRSSGTWRLAGSPMDQADLIGLHSTSTAREPSWTPSDSAHGPRCSSGWTSSFACFVDRGPRGHRSWSEVKVTHRRPVVGFVDASRLDLQHSLHARSLVPVPLQPRIRRAPLDRGNQRG